MLPLRSFDPDPNLPPHPLLHLPTALLLRVPFASWVKHPALGPGRFVLSARTHPWRFYPAHPPPEGLHFDSDQKAYLQLHRCQFPLTNTFAMTHYNLQGQTLPSIILDLAKPPKMSTVSRPPFFFSCPFSYQHTFAYVYPPPNEPRMNTGLRASSC